MTREERIRWLESALRESIVILDGGMGTMIQGRASARVITVANGLKIFRRI